MKAVKKPINILYITDFLEDCPKAVVEKFKGKIPDKKSINDFIVQIINNQIHSQIPINRMYVDIDCELQGVGALRLIPRNLYSTLLMVGVVVPFALVRGKKSFTVGGVKYWMDNNMPKSKMI